MSGRRAKALRREFTAQVGRAPQGAGAVVPRYGPFGGVQVLQKSEWRVWKKAYRETTRSLGRRRR